MRHDRPDWFRVLVSIALSALFVLAVGCADGASRESEPTATIEAESRLTPSGPLIPGEGVVSFGDALFGVNPGSGSTLLRSSDGEDWSCVELPAAPERIAFETGDLA